MHRTFTPKIICRLLRNKVFPVLFQEQILVEGPQILLHVVLDKRALEVLPCFACLQQRVSSYGVPVLLRDLERFENICQQLIFMSFGQLLP